MDASSGSHTVKVPAIIKRERNEEGGKEGRRKRRRGEREERGKGRRKGRGWTHWISASTWCRPTAD